MLLITHINDRLLDYDLFYDQGSSGLFECHLLSRSSLLIQHAITIWVMINKIYYCPWFSKRFLIYDRVVIFIINWDKLTNVFFFLNTIVKKLIGVINFGFCHRRQNLNEPPARDKRSCFSSVY
jgi:hypothetical protein